jgi:hypothetical protein
VRTDGRIDGETDMMKLTVVFFNFVSLPKKFRELSMSEISFGIIGHRVFLVRAFCFVYKKFYLTGKVIQMNQLDATMIY